MIYLQLDEFLGVLCAIQSAHVDYPRTHLVAAYVSSPVPFPRLRFLASGQVSQSTCEILDLAIEQIVAKNYIIKLDR